ncbi:MAG: HNH endonuclease [Pseudomonadota bacterium]
MLQKKIGKTEVTIDDINLYSDIGIGVLRRRFGSWRKALEASGLSQPKIGKRYADVECFENLLQVWTYYQRSPKYREMGLPPSEVGGKAYVKRFGTWNKALAAFVERINADLESEKGPPNPRIDETIVINNNRPTLLEEDRHEIKIGLRYKILLRDRFRCVICGTSPAIDNSCRLHVDHILPFSKGGKTEPDNLRSLCEKCNIGKGAQLEQPPLPME